MTVQAPIVYIAPTAPMSVSVVEEGPALTITSGGSAGAVNSVNFKVGDVTLVAHDVGAVSRSGDTMTGGLGPRVFRLTDAPTTLIDASLANDYRWPLAGNHTLAAPTNPVDGFVFTLDIQYQAGGPFTPSFTAGPGGYTFGTDGPPVWSTGTGVVDTIGWRYNIDINKWICQGWKLGNS